MKTKLWAGIFLLALAGGSPVGAQVQPCANGLPSLTGQPGDNKGNPPGQNDPFNAYPGNEYRGIEDLKIWGGVGEHQLVWERWANSRFVDGPNYFGNGHSWRHSYQWDIADAGWTAVGQAQLEIIYPDGYDIIFVHDSPTTWHPPVGTPDLLTQSGDDYYLQRSNGWRYHIVKHFNPDGSDYFLMTDFTDAQQNDYVLTYNSAHQVTQVTEPGGRFLAVHYTAMPINKVDFTTLATVAVVPPEGQYTTLKVTDSTAYRYLRYLSPDGGFGNVAEVEFYDKMGHKLSGTPFGSPSTPGDDPSKAFDGNTATFYSSSQPSGGFCGIDLGAGHATVIGSVRFYPRAGFAWAMKSGESWVPSGSGRFQGSNQAPASLPVVASVTTSDGRTVNYHYAAFNDPTLPYVYQMLSSAAYDDGTQATYSSQQIFPSTRPLITSFNDPRFPLAFTKSKTTYFTALESALGEIHTQVNYDTGETVAALATLDNNHVTPTVTFGNGKTSVFEMDHSSGANLSLVDAAGNKQSYVYNSQGYKTSITDARGATVGINNSAFANPLTTTHPDGSTLNWTRDSLDLPLTFKDELGNTTTVTRDATHRPTKVAYPDGSFDSFTYNGFGQPLTHRQRNGHTESGVYSASGLRTSLTDALGNVTHYGYDLVGRLASITDARGYITTYQYSLRDLLTQVTYPDGSSHHYAYDAFGNKITDTDELGHTTSYTYDTFNRCVSKTDPLGRKTQYIYRSGYFVENCPDRVISPAGKVTVNTYDAENHLLTQTVGYGTADAATTSYVYDGNYNITRMTDPNGNVWSYAYDTRNRKISQTDPLGHTTSYAYDAASNVIKITRPDGGITTNVYNTVHHLTKTTDPKGETTTMTYDASGNLLTTTDARGNTYTYAYDALNRRTSMTYPNGSVERYSYDSVGNMVSYTTRAGQTKTSVFDSRNREVSNTWSDGVTPSVSRTYDVTGKLLSSDDGVSSLAYAYDNANQLLSETQTNVHLGTPWKVAYGYDADGNRTSLTYPSGTVVKSTYTNRNQVSSISADGSVVANYSYDANGNVAGKAMADGTLTSYDYDDTNRLTSLDNTRSGVSFARFDYGYDNMNRRTYEQRDNAKGDVYGYDAIDQVTGLHYDVTNPASGSSGADRVVSYAYDATGNRTSVDDSVNGNKSYTANNLNEYSSVGGTAYGYDGNGNLASGNGLYFYDAKNRLTYAQVGSAIDQLSYDSHNRVVERTVNGTATYFVYDGWDLIEERNSFGTVQVVYVHGVRQDELLSKTDTSNTVYYHHNALGSVTDLTNDSGIVVEKYKYDAYGKPTIMNGSGTVIPATAYGNRFLFTGREYLAEVKLYDYRYRVYSPDLGRFLQTDPLRFSAEDVNLYRYVGNDPVNLTDYTGLNSNASFYDDPYDGGFDYGPLNTPGLVAAQNDPTLAQPEIDNSLPNDIEPHLGPPPTLRPPCPDPPPQPKLGPPPGLRPPDPTPATPPQIPATNAPPQPRLGPLPGLR